jgi:hypothetical protein
MATRSYIGKRLEDGKIRFIYCHFDGYPSHNGTLLTEHYSTEDKVNDLLDLGDISGLKSHPSECKTYGEDYQVNDRDGFFDGNVSYYYLFEDNEWQCFNHREDLIVI